MKLNRAVKKNDAPSITTVRHVKRKTLLAFVIENLPINRYKIFQADNTGLHKKTNEPAVIIVADNLQIANQRVADALRRMDASPILEMVKGCIAAGAEAIDINPGPLARCAEEKMTFLVETVQSVTNLPLVLDTTNPAALETGLEVSRNRTVINGFSLEPARLESILPLAKRFDTDIIFNHGPG